YAGLSDRVDVSIGACKIDDSVDYDRRRKDRAERKHAVESDNHAIEREIRIERGVVDAAVAVDVSGGVGLRSIGLEFGFHSAVGGVDRVQPAVGRAVENRALRDRG